MGRVDMGRIGVAAHVAYSQKVRRKRAGLPLLPLAVLLALAAFGGSFVAYVLWPTWSGASVALDAPAIPITIDGVLFEVPPGAIRAAVERHPGAHQRIDLAFQWPSLLPPPDGTSPPQTAAAASAPDGAERLFVTIAPLGSVLPPNERLRSIYPRYVEATASAGRDGLAILPFRSGSPYQGEDLVYFADAPERFFARCTRQAGIVPGSCIVDREVDRVVITLRFARDWLDDWRNVAAGFDRLLAQLRGTGVRYQ
jgi:hypothetical protein